MAIDYPLEGIIGVNALNWSKPNQKESIRKNIGENTTKVPSRGQPKPTNLNINTKSQRPTTKQQQKPAAGHNGL
uniref:hypothetical protein n=1 Tax=Mariniflexile sp. TaxID=1979402 RepID=UPI00404875A6